MEIFRFRMQSMLNLKVQIEKDVKNRLSVANSRLEHEKQRLNLYRSERGAVTGELSESTSRGITVFNIRRFNAYIDSLEQKVTRQASVVNMHSKSADKIREELVKAMQEKKTLEKLRERKYTEFRKEAGRKEQSVIDGIVSYNTGKTAGEA